MLTRLSAASGPRGLSSGSPSRCSASSGSSSSRPWRRWCGESLSRPSASSLGTSCALLLLVVSFDHLLYWKGQFRMPRELSSIDPEPCPIRFDTGPARVLGRPCRLTTDRRPWKGRALLIQRGQFARHPIRQHFHLLVHRRPADPPSFWCAFHAGLAHLHFGAGVQPASKSSA